MQHLTTKFIPIKTFDDEVYKCTFVRILTPNSYYSIKLPTIKANYKLGNMISPMYELEGEFIKTKKNWILRNIVRHEKLIKAEEYQTVMNMMHIIDTTTKFIKEGEEGLNIYDWLKSEIQSATKFDQKQFESKLLQQLGFAPEFDKSDIHSYKTINNLD